MESVVRTRFCLVPQGSLHVDAARIALFNHRLARAAGGQFLLRVEDLEGCASDKAGHVERLLEDLRWLGLEWDEGPEAVGPRGPYVQSERTHIYDRYYIELIESAMAYSTFDTAGDLDRMRRQALARGRPFRYRRPDRLPTWEEAMRAGNEGQPVVLRFRSPVRDVTVQDLILGPVTIPAEEFEDFVIRTADGRPTRMFASVIDDALMGVTHVIRGQQYLPQTHRQVLLQEALGFARPAYGHVPFMLDFDGSPLLREACVRDFRAAGYLPEVLAKYLASVGLREGVMAAGDQHESFRVGRISSRTAKFDRQMLLRLNAQAVAEATQDRLLAGLRDYVAGSGMPLAAADEATLRKLLQLAAGFRIFRDIDEKCRSLFVADEQVVYDDAAVRKVLRRGDPRGIDLLRMIYELLAGLAIWDADHVEGVISRLAGQAGLGLARVVQPIRVAVTGVSSTLPIGLLLEELGRARTLGRIKRCLAVCGA